MKIAIYGNNYQTTHLHGVGEFIASLGKLNVTVEIEESFHDYLSDSGVIEPSNHGVIKGNDFTAELAVSLGGDGTFLRTAQWVGDKQIPILGINTGHLGYLAAVPIPEALDMIIAIIKGAYRIEERSLLQLNMRDIGIDTWCYALNEVAVLKEDTASMIEVEAHINGNPLGTYKGDGLIISTPTGSTGYNLSVGGPIIEPTAPNWAISPIAAHSLTMRPLIVSSSSVIHLITSSRSASFRISLDGRSFTLPAGTALRISKAPFTTRVVQRIDHSFADTLRSKLYWGLDPR